MKYALKRQWFSLKDDFSIVDEKGRKAYRVNGAAFNFGNKLSFRDDHDNEMAFISQKMQPGGPTYEIYHGDDLQAVVRKECLSQQKCMFTADAPCPDDLHAEGNLGNREYTFTREGRTVGRVSKSLFGSSTYGVEVGRGEDELILLAGAVVIDLCFQDGASL